MKNLRTSDSSKFLGRLRTRIRDIFYLFIFNEELDIYFWFAFLLFFLLLVLCCVAVFACLLVPDLNRDLRVCFIFFLAAASNLEPTFQYTNERETSKITKKKHHRAHSHS